MKIYSYTNPVSRLEQTPTFPWIGIGVNGTVVLFSEKQVGTVINQLGSNYPVGKHKTDWEMSHFKPFIGELRIVCVNDECE